MSFAKIPREVIRDKEITAATTYIYNVMVDMANYTTHILIAKLETIALVAGKSVRTIQRHLATLIELGLVVRILRKNPNDPVHNMPSIFYVRGADSPRYANADDNAKKTKMSRIYDKNNTQKEKRENIERENQNLTLTGRVSELPENSDNSESLSAPVHEIQPELPENPKPSNQAETVRAEYDLTGVPDIMRPVAEYLLLKTGRVSITPHERKIILDILEKKHTPARVMKEISRQVERFQQRGKNLKQLTFSYIGAVLKGQTSRKPRKNSRTGDTDTPQATPLAVQEQEATPDVSAPLMPIEEAEKVIAEYVPAVKPEEPLPVAFQEFLGRIEAREQELREEYIATLPVAENGLTVFTEENSAELLRCRITPEEYLRLKFPEATEEELRSDYDGTYDSYSDFQGGDKRDIEQALKIDYACATCADPDHCQLPAGCKKGGSRLSVALKKDIRGRKYVQVVGGAVIRCKYGRKEQNSPEFESRLKRSGLSEREQKHTFTAYEHVGQPQEILCAKARAILAAKEHRSIVLAGNAGTGKTHLAVAIAIEAMRAGRQALFRSVPEMLDELRQTLREHGDFYGMMRRLKDVPCLVLDDLGKEKTTKAGLDYLFQIIDYRYSNGKQTVITTNALTMAELKNPYNADKIEPLISRLLENGDWVTIRSAENYRLRQHSESESVKAEKAEIEPELETPTYEPIVNDTPPESQVAPESDSFVDEDYSPEEERKLKVAEEAMQEIYAEIRSQIGLEPRKPKPASDGWEDDGYEQELAEREREMREKLCPVRKRYTPEERDREIQERLRQAQEILRTYEPSPAEKEALERDKELQSQQSQVMDVWGTYTSSVIRVEPVEDGLDDDDEDEYRLYGDTGIHGR